MLWGAFATLAVLIAAGLVLTVTVLQIANHQEYRIVEGSAPLVDAIRQMDDDVDVILGAARGFSLTQQTVYLGDYEAAIRDFDRVAASATQLASEPRDGQLVASLRRHFTEIRQLTDQQIAFSREDRLGNANEMMVEAARIHRAAPDYAGTMAEEHSRQQRQDLLLMTSTRNGLTMLDVVVSLVIIVFAAYLVWRIKQSLISSINRQVKRTESMIASMSDGVMLVDGDGKTVFLNPAGERLLGRNDTGVAIDRQAETYRFRSETGQRLEAKELPATQALYSGKPVHDVSIRVDRDGRPITVSMSATPIHEEGRVSGVVVTFRDVTERRRLEEEMKSQAESAQILSDAGAFFSSNIEPVWVTQAIAERVAEVLGDWCAVILKVPGSSELSVASIYHRDMASLGLAWSYIYRQPLVEGEGIIGQVINTGYPSLMQNVGSRIDSDTAPGYHAAPMKLASLLVLPLRTSREILGALVIAANDRDRAMTDDKLPLAQVLTERAALAIENARLYTDQVEARRKVEDLSRLKDEFLSIASHELRTPVTSIKGYTQLAKTLIRENDLATSEEYLNIALDQIDRMSRLILELLDVSRIETGRLEIRREEITWSNFVRDVVHRHHTAVSDRRFQLNVPTSERNITGDRDRLEQVLGNLLDNAVKYSPDGSEILVSVEERDNQLITAVADRGIGIPNDELAQVFERFHRGRQVSSTNYGGLGLGLYITKQIVERHGGSIWVESREGTGTTFFFSLPVTSPAPVTGEPETLSHV